MQAKLMKMRNVKDPVKNLDRIMEIVRLHLHEDQADEILDEYTRKAAEEFQLPVSLVSIILDDVQKFAASTGLEGWLAETNGSPVEWSFCANSIRSGKPFIVEDAPNHDMVKSNPLVTVEGIRCYAGAPLVTKNGYVVGNFCVLGSEERTFSDAEIERVKEYARKIMDRIESRMG